MSSFKICLSLCVSLYIYISVLLLCEWWGEVGWFLNHSNIEDVLNKRQPGNSPRKTKQTRTHARTYARTHACTYARMHARTCLFVCFVFRGESPGCRRVGVIVISNRNRYMISSNRNRHFQIQCNHNRNRLYCKYNRNERLLSRLHNMFDYLLML